MIRQADKLAGWFAVGRIADARARSFRQISEKIRSKNKRMLPLVEFDIATAQDLLPRRR